MNFQCYEFYCLDSNDNLLDVQLYPVNVVVKDVECSTRVFTVQMTNVTSY